MERFDIGKYLEEHRRTRALGLVLPHIDSSFFTWENHEREYPFRLDMPLGWGFKTEDARDIYRRRAIGYCDPREDLERFFEWYPDKTDGYVAVAFEDEYGMFWFHMDYVGTCIVDAEALEDAESMFNKCNVYRSSTMVWKEKLKPGEIVSGGWAWKPGIDCRNEPLCLDRAVKLDSGAWVNGDAER